MNFASDYSRESSSVPSASSSSSHLGSPLVIRSDDPSRSLPQNNSLGLNFPSSNAGSYTGTPNPNIDTISSVQPSRQASAHSQQDINHIFNASPVNPFFAMSNAMNVPVTMTPAYIEINLKIQRLEQEMAVIRQGLANVSAEVATARRTSTSSVFEELEDVVLKTVKPTSSLLPQEAPGFDCDRDHRDFPACRFFEDGSIEAYKKSKQGTTEVGQVIGKRGWPKKGEDNRATYEWLENPDGTPATERDYTLARTWGCEFILTCQSLGITLPPSWRNVDMRIKTTCYKGLQRHLPIFQLEYNNNKCKTLMNSLYYEMIGRNQNKEASNTSVPRKRMKLENAKYKIAPDDNLAINIKPAPFLALEPGPPPRNIETQPATDTFVDDPDGDLEDDPEADLKDDPEAEVSDSATASDTSDEGPRVPTAANIACPASPTAVLVPLPDPAAPSKPAVPFPKSTAAKDKAPTVKLAARLMDNSMRLLDSEPQPDLSVPMLPPPPVKVPRARKARAKKEALVTDRGESTTTTVSAPLGGVVPPATSPFADVPSPLPLSGPSAALSTPSTSTSVKLADPVKNVTSSSKSRKLPPRTITQWPPSEDIKGARWAYARAWYLQNNGTQDAFDQHYAKLSTSEKAKVRRDYKGKSKDTSED
ncbi:hypothetical protein L226DRAFT_576041 [Lentinus tigrinus ALCF2SS1-7]|uniref:Uncharacterized protein n=1 Tax=Lentinus tigrinus ALCF2SS1-6 TaxID=1328759 RepID=A0A5C2RV60_9APHY|nr:hypothetical protein L227DRAFT_616436 [Lentinus tigrinus ALCF2SS1-6]RPD68860.1 hypothetical protein L226DRAFT_576041 [Lentinus tigrinus ALCF2SS1-7]